MEGKIREIIPPGFSANTDDFITLLEKEANFKPFGSLLHTYKVHNVEEGADLTYLIHKVLTNTVTHEALWVVDGVTESCL